MDPRIVFPLSALLSLMSSVVIARFYAWPWLSTMDRRRALSVLVAPHMFLRFIGLSFLVPGVVSASLPAAFAAPAAYGDLVAGILAICAVIGLGRVASWSIPAVWIFNIWGAGDLLFAILEGVRSGLDPGALGAAFYLPTAFVPLLLVSHLLVFAILFRSRETSLAMVSGAHA